MDSWAQAPLLTSLPLLTVPIGLKLAQLCRCSCGRSLTLVSVILMVMFHVEAIITAMGHQGRESFIEHVFR